MTTVGDRAPHIPDDRSGPVREHGVDGGVRDCRATPPPRRCASSCPAPRSPTRFSGWNRRDAVVHAIAVASPLLAAARIEVGHLGVGLGVVGDLLFAPDHAVFHEDVPRAAALVGAVHVVGALGDAIPAPSAPGRDPASLRTRAERSELAGTDGLGDVGLPAARGGSGRARRSRRIPRRKVRRLIPRACGLVSDLRPSPTPTFPSQHPLAGAALSAPREARLALLFESLRPLLGVLGGEHPGAERLLEHEARSRARARDGDLLGRTSWRADRSCRGFSAHFIAVGMS